MWHSSMQCWESLSSIWLNLKKNTDLDPTVIFWGKSYGVIFFPVFCFPFFVPGQALPLKVGSDKKKFTDPDCQKWLDPTESGSLPLHESISVSISTETKQLTLYSLHLENMSSDNGMECEPKYIMTNITFVLSTRARLRAGI